MADDTAWRATHSAAGGGLLARIGPRAGDGQPTKGSRDVMVTEEPELIVYDRHLAGLLARDDSVNFQALLVQATHITGRTYETTLYDHLQTFRLLWHHLEATGYLGRAEREARSRLFSGHTSAAEAADLERFLTVYATARAG